MATKYRYERRLGGGGMAEVFLGHTVGAEGFERPVAIKRVLPSLSGDASFAAMFVNEARISAMLRHPNLVQVLDFDRDDDGRLFLVMELVEGKALDAITAPGSPPLPVPVTVHVIAEVLAGLAHAHELATPDGRPLGLVHRDVSPHNVLVSWDGAVKLSDFGIAKAMAATGAAASRMIKGKPLYMAPEQVTSPETVDQRADLFAVGVMMFELVCGRRVYQGVTSEEILADVIQVAHGLRQLPAPRVVRPDLPADVSQVAARLLAADRRQRFATARDAADALLATACAPARGAALLADELAARFPDAAPRRRVPSVRAAAPTALAGDGAAALAVTAADSSVVPALASAQTRTIDPATASPSLAVGSALSPRPARRGTRTVIAIAVFAVMAAVAAAVVVGMRGRGDRGAEIPDAGAAAGTAAEAGEDAGTEEATEVETEVKTGADAGTAEEAAAEILIDAAPPPDARERRTTRPDAGSGTGTGTGTGTGCDNGVPCDYNCDGVPDCR